MRRTGKTLSSVGSTGFECEEVREDSEECGESRFGSVRRSGMTVRSVESQVYECEEDTKDSERGVRSPDYECEED